MSLQTKKASVLVFSLVMVFILIIMAIGLASVVLTDKKGAISSRESTQAFQIADSGVEIARAKLSQGGNGSKKLSEIFSCGSGKVSGNVGSGKEYELTFRDTADVPMDCDRLAGDVRSIKATGTYAGDTRAIEVAWAALSGFGAWVLKADVDNPDNDDVIKEQANKDGLVSVVIECQDNNTKQRAIGYTDATTNPSELVAEAVCQYDSVVEIKYASFTMPVKKADYWRVEADDSLNSDRKITVKWLPLMD